MDLVVHIFSKNARAFYDLERLWRDGKKLDVSLLIEKKKRSLAAENDKKLVMGTVAANREPEDVKGVSANASRICRPIREALRVRVCKLSFSG